LSRRSSLIYEFNFCPVVVQKLDPILIESVIYLSYNKVKEGMKRAQGRSMIGQEGGTAHG
jgi:hypothetical protein